MQFKLLVALLSVVAAEIDVPGCGKISEIRWNNECVQSSLVRLANKHFNILKIKNLLLFDGVLYYTVPHATDADKASAMAHKLSQFSSEEMEFVAVNISRSPLKFKNGDGEFSVQEVQEINQSIILQEQNLFEFDHPAPPYLEYIEKLPYVPTKIVHTLLCRVLQYCDVADEKRQSSLILSSTNSSFHLDWETGVSVKCFAREEVFPLQMSKKLSKTLFIIRNAIIYKQLVPSSDVQLPMHVQQQCLRSGFGHDTSAGIQYTKKYNISFCTIFKNEEQYLLEWIAYHTLIGVDHFYLYNDDSDDESLTLLQPLIQTSLVTLHNISTTLLNEQVGIRLSVLKHCSYKYSPSSKWLMSMDVEEFIVVKGDKYNGNIQAWIHDNPILRNQTGSVQMAKQQLAGQYYPLQQGQLLTAESVYSYGTQLNDFKVLANTNGLDYIKDRVAFSLMPIRDAGLQENCKLERKFDTKCIAPRTISIYHYLVKYYDTTLLRPSDVNANSSIIPEHGKSHEFWQIDNTLSSPQMTTKICAQMKQLNSAWYEAKKLCDSYDS